MKKTLFMITILLLSQAVYAKVMQTEVVPAEIDFVDISEEATEAYACCQTAMEIPFCQEKSDKKSCDANCPGACQKITVNRTGKSSK